jgi:hypothetical protein
MISIGFCISLSICIAFITGIVAYFMGVADKGLFSKGYSGETFCRSCGRDVLQDKGHITIHEVVKHNNEDGTSVNLVSFYRFPCAGCANDISTAAPEGVRINCGYCGHPNTQR